MFKLELLSDNLVIILSELLNNQRLAKYLYYNTKTPLAEPYVNPSILLNTRIFPMPFDEESAKEDMSQLRVYYESGNIDDVVVENIAVNFDIIVAKSLWLINVDGKSKVRPYEIMREVVNTFHGKSIETVGRLDFVSFRHLYVNERFDALQLYARLTHFTK